MKLKIKWRIIVGKEERREQRSNKIRDETKEKNENRKKIH